MVAACVQAVLLGKVCRVGYAMLLLAALTPHRLAAQATCTPDTTQVRTAWRRVPLTLTLLESDSVSLTAVNAFATAVADKFQPPALSQQAVAIETGEPTPLPAHVTSAELAVGILDVMPSADAAHAVVEWKRPPLASGWRSALDAAIAAVQPSARPPARVRFAFGPAEGDAPSVWSLGTVNVQLLAVSTSASVTSYGRDARARGPLRVVYEVYIDENGRVVPDSWRSTATGRGVAAVRAAIEATRFSPARIGACAVTQAIRGTYVVR